MVSQRRIHWSQPTAPVSPFCPLLTATDSLLNPQVKVHIWYLCCKAPFSSVCNVLLRLHSLFWTQALSDLSAGKYKKNWEEINWKQSRTKVYLSPLTTVKSNPKKLSAETGLKLSRLQTKKSLFKLRLHKLGAFSFFQKSALEGKFDLFVLLFSEPVLLHVPYSLFGNWRRMFPSVNQ